MISRGMIGLLGHPVPETRAKTVRYGCDLVASRASGADPPCDPPSCSPAHDSDPPRIRKTHLIGDPDPALISTSMVERANLSMRAGMRRFTRQTMGFRRKAENHVHAVRRLATRL